MKDGAEASCAQYKRNNRNALAGPLLSVFRFVDDVSGEGSDWLTLSQLPATQIPLLLRRLRKNNEIGMS